MKLNELNLDGYKHILKNKWNERELLLNWLHDKGFESVGDGTWSSAWISDECDFVVKTGFTKDNIFKKFVDFCHSINDPHFPKFGRLKPIDNETFVIFMEKLQPSDFSRNLSWFLRSYSEHVIKLKNMQYKESLETFFGLRDINENDLMPYIEKWLDEEKNVDIRRMRVNGKEQINSLTKSVYDGTIKMNMVFNDIGPGNIMERNDGTLVLNDPIYG